MLLHCSLYHGIPPKHPRCKHRDCDETFDDGGDKKMMILTVFACAAHGESEDRGGIAVAVAVVLKFA